MEYAPFKTMSYGKIGTLSKPAKCAGTLLNCYAAKSKNQGVQK